MLRQTFRVCLPVLALLFAAAPFACAQEVPALGAEIWIEPGQTPAQIDAWFGQLEQSGLSVARIFVMWSYVQAKPGQWDFSLYDTAFEAAQHHHIRIVATLTPTGPPLFARGDGNQGVGVVASENLRPQAADYIARVVERYRTHPALDTWLLLNEPGEQPHETPDVDTAFRGWLPGRYASIERLNETWGTNFAAFATVTAPQPVKSWNHNAELDWRAFWIHYLTTQLQWLADEVHKRDTQHPLHVNPAGVDNNLAHLSDDLPSWRPFLDTLGCSIHPAWHFSLVDPDEYETLVAYTNDLIRGSIEPKPYWVTELQGGNNIYSGSQPMEPTAADTAQWLWSSVGAGARRILFWLLNARRAGVESGEWSMLDFQQRPGRNLVAASRVAAVLKQHADFFATATPSTSPVTVLLSLDTMTFEEAFHRDDDPARNTNAQFFEALGFYKSLAMLGVPPRIKYMDDYDWETPSKGGTQHRLAIVPDARVLTAAQIARMQRFVDNGNTLLITGLSGFYGPHAEAMPLAGFPLGSLTSADLKEVHLPTSLPSIQLSGGALPAQMWQGSIAMKSTGNTGKPLAHDGDEVTAAERTLPGGGSVIWIPSPIGMGSWFRDRAPLSSYLSQTLLPRVAAPAFALSSANPACMLRVLVNAKRSVTILTNGTDEMQTCVLTHPVGGRAESLWGGASAPVTVPGQATYSLPAHETVVTLWSTPLD